MLHRLLSKDERTIALEIASQAAATVQGAATTGNGTQSILNADGTRTVSGPNLAEINGSTVTTATHVGDVTPPGAPTGITTATESGVLTVDWDGTLDGGVPGDFDHITVYAIKSDATLGVSLGKLKMRGTVTTAGLTPGDEYDIYVTAEDDACLADGTPAHNVSMESGPYNVTIAGSTGDAVSTIDIEYATGSSETTAPASGWSTDSPTWAEGLYVWQRTKVTTGSGEVSYSDPACIQGAKGATGATGPKGDSGSDGIAGKDGVGIDSTTITYAVSSSGTSAPTSGWKATPPTATAGQYMWTRSVWAYTDGTSETGYAVGKIGDTGAKGATGATGVGFASIRPQYYLSTSKTELAGGSWLDTCPTWTPGTYYWTRSVLTKTDGTINYTDSVLDQASTKANETAYATTQYVWHDDDGLHVSQTGDHDLTGLNMLLTASKMALRHVSTELATFSSNLIELGKNSVSAVIKLCGGTGIIRSDAFGTGRMLSIIASNVGISAGANGVMSLNGGSALGSKAKTLVRSDITSGQASHKELGSNITQTGTDIAIKMTQMTNSIGAPYVEDFDINLHQDANGKVNLNITPDYILIAPRGGGGASLYLGPSHYDVAKREVGLTGTNIKVTDSNHNVSAYYEMQRLVTALDNAPVVTTISGWTVLSIGSLRVVSRTITAGSNAHIIDSWGSVYESTTAFATPAYPVRFASMPYSSIEYLHGDPGADAACFVERLHDATEISAGSFYLWRPTTATIGHPVYTVLAVGTV